MEKWCRDQVIEHTFLIEYDHHSNGLLERANRSTIDMLRKETIENPWDPLQEYVMNVVQNLNFSYLVDLNHMPIEVWHGFPQVLEEVKAQRELRHKMGNKYRSQNFFFEIARSGICIQNRGGG